MKEKSEKSKPRFSPVVKNYMLKGSFILLSLILLHSCKKEETSEKTVAQIVFTSDLHYGITRGFRGATGVDAGIVNKELVKQINSVPAATFPADGGLNAGNKVGSIDYIIIAGDITNRQQTGTPNIQSATASWAQFNTDYLNGITLRNDKNLAAPFLLECGNHDVSNAIGYTKTMNPLTDPAAMVNIYNLMLSPATPKTSTTYNYNTDKINYSKDIVGVHFMFINIWPDSAARIWMQQDLSGVNSTTPVVIFTHDQPTCESKHFTNPNGAHTINSTDKFENMVPEKLKDGITTSAPTTLEQKNLVAFLKAHTNIKAYFHGNDNKNEFYTYTGTDGDINLKVFRVDSPIKGTISGIDAGDGIGDETKLSFQVIVIDGKAKSLTVREVLWNTAGSGSALTWGANSTISLN
jgi:predicted MPP superfamily phosphohydrolase